MTTYEDNSGLLYILMTSVSDNTFLIIIAAIIIIAFLSGIAIAASIGKRSKEKVERALYKRLSLTTFKDNKLRRENKLLNEKLERYLNYFIRIPQAVKNVNSHLTFDDLITSIIRMVKEFIETDQVEIYMFDIQSKSLKLIAAYGTNRGRAVNVNIGEGVIGSAAETKLMLTKAQLGIRKSHLNNDIIESATPILFKDELMGVIGIGKVNHKNADYKRFFAMIADLAAVALKNCEYLDTAKEEATKDALTGLFNKRYFFERAHEAVRQASNYALSFSVFMFDIDNFKHYNDTNGHMAGDVLLKELSKLLKGMTRSVNTLARYGGEEFIVLIQNKNKQAAMADAESIRLKIAAHPFPYAENQPLGCISISGGVAEFPADGHTIEKIIKCADEALYKSKSIGRNRVHMYESSHFSTPEHTI